MTNKIKLVLALGVVVGWLAAAPAQAQLRQGAFMNNLMAASATPNWFGGGFGVNPGFNPGFAGAGFVNPYAAGAFGAGVGNPYAAAAFNPYGGGGGGGAGMLGGGYGYFGYPPTIGPGYYLMGTAEIMKAYGTVVTADQQARIMAEQANQAHIDTLKKRAEYEMWLKANTIPYSEIQARIAGQTLRRVRAHATPAEITEGKSLNLLLRDLEGIQGKKIVAEPIPLSEDMLKHLNVTKKYGNLGLLRDDGRFSWPSALLSILNPKEREEMELQAQGLVRRAIDNGNVPGNLLRDLQNSLELIGEKLAKKVNEIPVGEYLAAKRFLNDFNSARIGLEEPGNAVAYFNYLQWAKGGKTVQELVDYLIQNGLRFAPAVQGDESAYQRVQGALAAYDAAYNQQMAAAAVQNSAKE